MTHKKPETDGVPVRRGEHVEAKAPGVTLTDRALYVGGERVARDEVTGIEFDRGRSRGAMVFVGREGELGRAECVGSDRVALEDVEKRLAPPAKGRHIEVLLERTAFAPGETVRGYVVVNWPKARIVRGVRVGVCGAEETAITRTYGSRKNRRTVTHRECATVVEETIILWGGRPVSWITAVGEAMSRLLGKLGYGELPAGRHRWPFEFTLPADAPPTYEGAHATVGYRLFAHVDVPLDFDLACEAPLRVVPPRRAHVGAVRAARSDEASGLLKSFRASADMEIEVDRTPLRSGADLKGRLVLTNRSQKRLRAIDLKLVRYEWAQAEGHVEESETVVESGRLVIPDPTAERQTAAWGIRIPPEATPYAGRYSRARLALRMEVDVAMGFDLSAEVALEMA